VVSPPGTDARGPRSSGGTGSISQVPHPTSHTAASITSTFRIMPPVYPRPGHPRPQNEKTRTRVPHASGPVEPGTPGRCFRLQNSTRTPSARPHSVSPRRSMSWAAGRITDASAAQRRASHRMPGASLHSASPFVS